jgi:hypothetical protein
VDFQDPSLPINETNKESILFTLVFSAISSALWVISTLIVLILKLEEWNVRFWMSVFNWGPRTRFWIWLGVVNASQLVLWTAVTLLFWDANVICIQMNMFAELIPFHEKVNTVIYGWR